MLLGCFVCGECICVMKGGKVVWFGDKREESDNSKEGRGVSLVAIGSCKRNIAIFYKTSMLSKKEG